MSGYLIVHALGEPAPQGSKRHVGNGRLIEASPKVGPWRKAVYRAARDAIVRYGWEASDTPVDVCVDFYLPRPASSRRARPSVRPDLDKLLRSTLDGLDAAGVFTDDSRVVQVRAAKHYAIPDSFFSEPGAYIIVRRVQ